jgi:hypothetical protein
MASGYKKYVKRLLNLGARALSKRKILPMKKLLSFSLFVGIIILILVGAKSAEAQRVIVTRSTVIIPPSTGSIAYTNGHWKWSTRFQKYIWVAHPRARLRVHRGYRVRI